MDDKGQGRPTLLVTGPARELCRAVGTTAWAVLADVALDAEVDAKGRRVGRTNVRRIAAHLAISKVSAAWAFAGLADAGFVICIPTRRGTGGRFAPSGYELRLEPDAGAATLGSSPGPVSPSRAPEEKTSAPEPAPPSLASDAGRSDGAANRPRRARRSSQGEQQPLFDLASESSGLP